MTQKKSAKFLYSFQTPSWVIIVFKKSKTKGIQNAVLKRPPKTFVKKLSHQTVTSNLPETSFLDFGVRKAKQF